MLVVGQGDQFRAYEPLLRHQLDLAGVPEQGRCEQNRDVVDVFTSVSRGFLSLHVGVDRHLGDASSTDGADEVDGCCATLFPYGFQR